jgi:hypothetical protein
MITCHLIQRNLAQAARLAVMLLGFMGAPALAAPPEDLLAKAEAGEAGAQYALARLYERGEGVARDDFEAVRWLARAAENGHARAALDYGWMLANGYGVIKDEVAAYYWFARAAAAGIAGAQAQRDHLGLQLDDAVRARQDARVAELTMDAPTSPTSPTAPPPEGGQEALPTQDLRDVIALRRAYNTPGRGDDAALKPALRRQAELGDALAQNMLGVLLMRSIARADKLEALEWFRAAAWSGLPAAQYNLADALARGVGGARDLRAAADLLRQARAGLPARNPTDYASASRMFRERAEYTDPYYAAMQGYASAASELEQLIQLRRSEIMAQLEMARRLGE